MTEPENNLILNFKFFRTDEPERSAEIIENLCDLLRVYGEISFIEVHIGCEVRHRTPGTVRHPF